ncbi:MAG TPA: hypothetical protein VF543_22235 [Pyrinomonadaceae bacterium]|jgi:hypothetical protein
MSFRFTEHIIARPGRPLPPVNEGLLYDIVLGSNGTFIRGRRPGLEACMPFAATRWPHKKLAHVIQYVQWGFPKVPARLVEKMLITSRFFGAGGISPVKEVLFHLSFKPDIEPSDNSARVLDACQGWVLEYPQQNATGDKVELVHKGRGTSEERAVIEVHSHHSGRAEFSDEDDEDEGGASFRIYGVLGEIFDRPKLRTRVGLFGFFYEYPAAEFFEMPQGVRHSQIYDFGVYDFRGK